MKRILSLILCLCLCFGACMSFVSCGDEEKPDKVAYVLAEKGNTYSLGLANNFKTSFENAGGAVTMETFPANTVSFSEFLQHALDCEADVIFFPNSIVTAEGFLKNCKDFGIEIPILAGDTWESSVVLESVKDTGLEVYCSTFFDESETENKKAAEFVSGFKQYLHDNSEFYEMNGSNDMVAAVSALGFDAYNVAMQAIRKAADEKGEKFTSADVAGALWGIEYDGVTGSISFDENGDAIKDTAVIKKAKADGSGFDVVKNQTFENNAKKAKGEDYPDTGIAVDSENKIIRIGVFEPTTGDNSAGGKQEVIGIRYAHSLDNAVTIDGVIYTVELDVSDNGSLKEYAMSTATKLVEDECVIVIGSYGSDVSIAAAPVFEEAGLAAIGASCTNTDVTDHNEYYFRTCFVDPSQGSALADFAHSLIKEEK